MSFPTTTPTVSPSRPGELRARQKANQLAGKRLAEVCKNLKPFQSLEFDPDGRVVTIVTELIVPSNDPGQVLEILEQRNPSERIVVRRFADSFKITLSRSMKL
jgi:hypothetical protein